MEKYTVSIVWTKHNINGTLNIMLGLYPNITANSPDEAFGLAYTIGRKELPTHYLFEKLVSENE